MTVIMVNQTAHFAQPPEMRNSVMVEEDLLQDKVTIEQKPLA